MASINTSSGWMTSWIYAQDLRSVYMNSSLYAMFRPGIHNANIKLINGKSSDNTDTLIACIEKGTTFIFSNDYASQSYVSGSATKYFYRRNFVGYENELNNTRTSDSRVPVIIKCTALQDLKINITTTKDTTGVDYATNPWTVGPDGNTAISTNPAPNPAETIPPEVLYLCASMRYDEDGEDTTTYVSPVFFLTRNNPFYGDSRVKNEATDSPEHNQFFYYHTSPSLCKYISSGVYRLPDGSSHYGSVLTTNMPKFSYLMIGVILDNKSWSGGTGTYSYEYFDSTWMTNHTFTGRGLPEYRYNMIVDSNNKSPDFVIPIDNDGTSSIKFNRLYIDFNNVINYGSVYNTSIDWERAYRVARNTATSAETDRFYYTKLAGTEGTDYISYSLTDDEKSILDARTESKAVIDFTFITTKSYINSASTDLSTILTTGSSSKMHIHNHREIVSAGSPDDLNIVNKLRFDYDSNLAAEDGRDGYYLNLDISSVNVDRLTQFITNTDIIPKIINNIRLNDNLDPNYGESIIPVAISFRLFPYVYEYTLSEDTEVKSKDYYIKDSSTTGYSKVTNPTGSPKAQGYYERSVRTDCYDKITSVNSVNPINVLSLMDLNYRMTKMNPITGKAQDTYSIINVME